MGSNLDSMQCRREDGPQTRTDALRLNVRALLAPVDSASADVVSVTMSESALCTLHSSSNEEALPRFMPQINKSIEKDLSFSVSPWQSKQATPEIIEDQSYQEIQLPLKRKTREHLAESTAEASQRPRASRRKGTASEWQRTKKHQPPDEGQARSEQPATNTPSSPDPAHDIDSTSDTETDTVSTDTVKGSNLQGTAVLALLPNGQISGHILDTHSSACFGFMARQLTAERECTRDTEWRLLHATIIDYKSSKEMNFAAERTAEDAATIQAPLQMHGEEEQLIAALQGHADADMDINFKFQCTTILVIRFREQKACINAQGSRFVAMQMLHVSRCMF